MMKTTAKKLFWLAALLTLLTVGLWQCQTRWRKPAPTPSPATPSTRRVVELTTDDPGANSRAILAASIPGSTVLLPPGKYPIYRLELEASMVTYVGSGAEPTELFAADDVLIELGSVSAVKFDNMSLLATKASLHTNYLGLVTARNKVIQDLTFTRCQFSAPYRNTNGIKLVADTPDSRISDLKIIDCRFESLGRMGVEFQNHQAGAVTLKDIWLMGNSFADLGLVAGAGAGGDHHGMAISVSGAADVVVIDQATISNPYNIAIEVVGAVTRLRIRDIKLSNLTRRNTEADRPLAALSIQPGAFDPVFEFVDARISEVTCTTGITSGSVFLKGLRGSAVENCGFSTPDGWVSLVDCNDNTFTANAIQSKGLFGLFIEHSEGRRSASNQFVDLSLDCSQSETFYAAIQTKGGGSQNNTFTGGSIAVPKGTDNFLAQTVVAANALVRVNLHN